MAATYDDSLPTNRDHVRHLIRDTDTSAATFTDNEIDATLSEETATGKALKYFAAARLLDVLRIKYASAGAGVMEKEVDDLRIRYGTDDIEGTLSALASEYRKRGSFLLTPSSTSRVFRALV